LSAGPHIALHSKKANVILIYGRIHSKKQDWWDEVTIII